MKIFRIFIMNLLVLSAISCSRKSNENVILLADREAPMGWIYLKIYNDNTFEYISKSISDQQVFPGTVRISNDTLYFKYSVEIPKAGKTAIINKNYVQYLESPELVEIKLNKLKN